jgi:hypothetical protein
VLGATWFQRYPLGPRPLWTQANIHSYTVFCNYRQIFVFGLYSVLLCVNFQVLLRWPTLLKALQGNCSVTCTTRTKDKKHKIRNISLNVT